MNDNTSQLSPTELKVLRALASVKSAQLSLEDSERLLGLPRSTLSSVARLLESKGLLKVVEEEKEEVLLTERGQEALAEGLPEERLAKALLSMGGAATIERLKAEVGSAYSAAIGSALRLKAVKVEGGLVKLLNYDALAGFASRLSDALKLVSQGRRPNEDVLQTLKSRGLIKVVKGKAVKIAITDEGLRALEASVPVISKLTHEILAKGEWKSSMIKPYDVTAEPPRLLPARKHPLAVFIEELKDIMVELGFVEVEGPLIEVELFNFDALFQPQDHPAREIQDTLWPDLPPADISAYGELVDRVRETHEKGWGYPWNNDIASRRILRSQTTAVSIRVLSGRPKPPIRFFTIDKVFRADPVDATHLSDFHQLDGIMGWPGYSFRDLLGFLTQFARKLGLNIKFKPAYFPFTEPSVEGYAKIGNSLVEVFGAGLFRPEVLRIAGVDYPVGAWGMGVERLALAKYGLKDVRDLYSKDAEFLASFRFEV
ncbi:MAG: phenylalanine--tRNA ligase subunit alpha [Acidilobus sp.]|jgi:phenylalanyl-tRNA synthetase alpha chain|nr:phenylalanine--tRNA ligase subunit alpha [Acidilobus sp.]